MRNKPIASNEGFVSIFGNVGFGSHKSFCHLRGPAALQNNDIFNPGLAGIRIVGGTDGITDSNLIVQAGEAGISLKRTANLTVSGNYMRQVGTVGIVSEGSTSGLSTDITENFITANSQKSGRSAPGIFVGDTGISVHGNVIKH